MYVTYENFLREYGEFCLRLWSAVLESMKRFQDAKVLQVSIYGTKEPPLISSFLHLQGKLLLPSIYLDIMLFLL